MLEIKIIGKKNSLFYSFLNYSIVFYTPNNYPNLSQSMEEQGNLQTLRRINNNSYIQVEHDAEQNHNEKQGKQNKQSSKPDEKKKQSSCGHDHSHDGDDDHGHGDSHQEGHGHGHTRVPGQKNYVIIVYTIFTCLSCLYLETQHLNPLLADKKSQIMSYLTFFDVFMCLWSYIQTMRINSHVEKLQEKDPKPYKLDYTKRCKNCDYWKGPRISHCRTCGKCIYKLDHHCMWTQTCIGHCNQRPFYLFCFYMTIGVIQFWYSTIRVGHLLISNCNFFGAFEPGVYILWIITCFSAGLVGMMIVGLCFGHSFFVATNYTTLDAIKTRRSCSLPFLECRSAYIDADGMNSWDRGQIQNLKMVFGDNILTFWLPFGRKIQNQHIFEPMNPEIEPIVEKKVDQHSMLQADNSLKGKKIKVNDKIIQL